MPDPSLLALLAIAGSVRRKMLRTAAKNRQRFPKRTIYDIIADMLAGESLFARTLRDGQVLGWLQGGTDVVKALPPAVKDELKAQNTPSAEQVLADSMAAASVRKTHPDSLQQRPPLPPAPLFPDRPGDPPPAVRLPAIEKAAKYLQTRLAYTPDEFRLLDDDARAVAFTVAKAVSVDAVEKVKAALVDDVAQGGTLKAFRQRIAEVIDESALAPHRVEALYRTHVARAYSTGQWDVHDHPLISSSFVYVLRSCVHDFRTRADHLAFEHLGMLMTDGSRGPIYRADDPVIRHYASPWSWNCRCVDVFLSVMDAARHGVREAVEWERTGVPPINPEFVSDPGFPLPSGWVPIGSRLRPVI